MDEETTNRDKVPSLVSIIIPVYNGEKYIERALDSVVNQSYHNIEVIIIDDGSTDNTRALCLPYVEKYENFSLLSIKNEGVSNARNVGIEMAKGEYITFLDADDELMPTFIGESVAYIEETESDIACFNYVIVEGDELTAGKPFELENNIVESEEEKKILITFLFLGRAISKHYYGQIFGTPWGKLFRLELLKNNSIKFPYGLCLGEDNVFLVYAIARAQRIAFKNDRLYKYYVLKNSACHRYREKRLEEKIMMFNAARKALHETNIEIDNFDNLFLYNVLYPDLVYYASISDKPLRGKIRDIVDKTRNPLILNGLLLSPPISWKYRIRRLLLKLHCYHILAFFELLIHQIKNCHAS